jgi:hypothetical protein
MRNFTYCSYFIVLATATILSSCGGSSTNTSDTSTVPTSPAIPSGTTIRITVKDTNTFTVNFAEAVFTDASVPLYNIIKEIFQQPCQLRLI